MEIDKAKIGALIKDILKKVSGKEIDERYLEIEYASDYPEIFARCCLETYDDTIEWEQDTTKSTDWEPSGIARSVDVQVDQYIALDIVDGITVFYFAVLDDDDPDNFQDAIEQNQDTGKFIELDESVDLVTQLEEIANDPEKIKAFADAIRHYYGPSAEELADSIDGYGKYYESSRPTGNRLREATESDMLFIANKIHSNHESILKIPTEDYLDDPVLLEYLIEDYLKSSLSEPFDSEKVYSDYDKFKDILLGLFIDEE